MLKMPEDHYTQLDRLNTLIQGYQFYNTKNNSKCKFGHERDDQLDSSGVTSIGQGGQLPPRFSGVNTTLIGGVVSVQVFRRFARVSAPFF